METEMKRLVALSAASLMAASLGAVGAAPAFAGGMAEPVKAAQPVAPVVTPAAPAGYNWTGFYGGADLGYSNIGDAFKGNGGTVGLHLGYLQDFGNWVGGVELAHNYGSFGLTPNGKADTYTDLKLKAGPNYGKFFPYVTVGYSRMNIKIPTGTHDSGYAAGVGVDYALNRNWVLGGEVLTHQYKNFAGNGYSLHNNTAALRVSYHF